MDRDIVIDWARFHLAQQALGQRLEAVVGWFGEDGDSAIRCIIRATEGLDALTVIRTAGLLKTDAMQIGALSVSELAEACETAARICLDEGGSWQHVCDQAAALARGHKNTMPMLWSELANCAFEPESMTRLAKAG